MADETDTKFSIIRDYSSMQTKVALFVYMQLFLTTNCTITCIAFITFTTRPETKLYNDRNQKLIEVQLDYRGIEMTISLHRLHRNLTQCLLKACT